MNDIASPRRLGALFALTAVALGALASAGCLANAGQQDPEAAPAETAPVDAGVSAPDASLHTLGRNRCFLNCMHGSKGNDMGGFCAVACGFL